LEPQPEERKVKQAKKLKEPTKVLELELPADEVVENVEKLCKIPAPKKKRIIKKVIEIEESDDTEEEVIEEVVRVPNQKKINNVKQSRAIMKEKLHEENTKRNMNSLFNY
jgi:hypothetical protein